MATERQSNVKKNSPAREAVEWVVSLALAVALALAIHTWVGQLISVSGPSMQPGLWTNERVLVGKLEYYFKQPKRGDIVLVRFPNSQDHYIKRVMGVAGDRLSVSGGQLYINGQAIVEPYVAEPINMDMEEITVPEGTVFVMGDNRNDSTDSRESHVGPISLREVEGRAYCVVWPLDKWKKLTRYDGVIQ